MDEELKKEGKMILEQMEKLVVLNPDRTYTVTMPHNIDNYIIKELTIREEQKAKSLATSDIPEDEMCMIRSIVSPKIATSAWQDMPAKIKKRLEYVKRYLDGDFDFLG